MSTIEYNLRRKSSVLSPKKVEVMSHVGFRRFLRTSRDNIKSVQIIPPNIRTGNWGGVAVQFKTTTLRPNV